MATFTLKVPMSAEKKEFAEMVINDLDNNRSLFTMVTKAMADDELNATEILLNGLRVSGDEVSKITGNLYALRSAARTIIPLLRIEEGELKKN